MTKKLLTFIASVLVIAVFAAACADTATAQPSDASDLDAQVSQAILQANAGQYAPSDFATEAHEILAVQEDGDMLTVYATALYLEFGYGEDELTVTGGSHMPVAITFTKDAGGAYELEEYWMPRDGTEYGPSIEGKFPADIVADALDLQQYVLAETQACYAQAVAHGEVDTDALIRNLVDVIASSPAEASNPGAYIEAHTFEYRELLYFGDATLRYAYQRFLAGGQTDLQSHILLAAMRELLGDEAAGRSEADTPQIWFDQWKDQAVNLRESKTPAFMAEHYPKTMLMLRMLEKRSS
ncbi:MAG: hypothetical protein PWQ55_511 [Chloroflexota bacterium]|nr:hypothetical protein [Chloroflexota bacterium]